MFANGIFNFESINICVALEEYLLPLEIICYQLEQAKQVQETLNPKILVEKKSMLGLQLALIRSLRKLVYKSLYTKMKALQ